MMMMTARLHQPSNIMTTIRPSRFAAFGGPNGMNDKTSQGISPSFASSNLLASASTKNIWSKPAPGSRDGPASRGSDGTSPSAFGSLSSANEPGPAAAAPWPASNPWSALDNATVTRPNSGSTSPTRTRDDRGSLHLANRVGHGASFLDMSNPNGVIGSSRNGFSRGNAAAATAAAAVGGDDEQNDNVSLSTYHSSGYTPNGYVFEPSEGSPPFRHQDQRRGRDNNFLDTTVGSAGAFGSAAHSRDGSVPSSRHSHNSNAPELFALGEGFASNDGFPGQSGGAVVKRPLSTFMDTNSRAFEFNNTNQVSDAFHNHFHNSLSLHDASDSPQMSMSMSVAAGPGPTLYPGLIGQPQPSMVAKSMSQPWADDPAEADYSGLISGQIGSIASMSASEHVAPMSTNFNPHGVDGLAPTPNLGVWSASRPASRDPRAFSHELDRRMLHHQPWATPSRQPQPYLPHQQFFPPSSTYSPHYNQGGFDPVIFGGGYRQPMPHVGGYPLAPMSPYMSGHGSPRQKFPQEHDSIRGMRSMLLEEFKGHKNHGRYTLRDIYGHVVEFSGDQHGSRFIQSKLETANSDEKEVLFREISPNAIQLMKDVFGNYVIQKFFAHGNQMQKKVLAGHMKGKLIDLSLQMYSCRVVQKALEHVLVEQQAEMAKELASDVLRVIKDQNGNHVIQKIVELVPREHIGFIMDAVRGQVSQLASHLYGCRVIQRLLEHGSEHDKKDLLEELHSAAQLLVTDQYGNYVAQHIIQHGRPDDRSRMVALVTGQLLTLSKHKFASNVVEKCIQNGSAEERKTILGILTQRESDPSGPLYAMMKDQYGNYVIQKMYLQLKGDEKTAFVDLIVPLISHAKRTNPTRQITALERVIFGPSKAAPNHVLSRDRGDHAAPSSVHAATLLVDVQSAVPTPSLTNGLNSPQSVSPTSVGGNAGVETRSGGALVAQKPVQGDLEPAGPQVHVQEM